MFEENSKLKEKETYLLTLIVKNRGLNRKFIFEKQFLTLNCKK